MSKLSFKRCPGLSWERYKEQRNHEQRFRELEIACCLWVTRGRLHFASTKIEEQKRHSCG